MVATQETINKVNEVGSAYKYGFVTDLESEKAPLGLNEDIVKFISSKKNEPKWLLDWRLKAYKKWLTMKEPDWAMVDYPKIDFQDIYYYARPKSMSEDKGRDMAREFISKMRDAMRSLSDDELDTFRKDNSSFSAHPSYLVNVIMSDDIDKMKK